VLDAGGGVFGIQALALPQASSRIASEPLDIDRPVCIVTGMKRPSRREELLQTAADLFYREGIRPVGVDRLVQRAGVSKMTLYHHFASKDELAVAYLARRDDAVHRFIEARVVELAPDPRQRPLAVFDAFAEQVKRDGYRGCHLINTLVEFPEPGHLARQFALDRNAAWRSYFVELVRGAGRPDAEQVGAQLFLLIEGAFVTAAMERSSESMRFARAAAEALLSARGTRPRRSREPRH
jgi:AcrR family transcriptional regulator